MTQTWHADEEALREWARGSAAPVPAASLEAHLIRCDECRRRMAALAPSSPGSDVVRRWDALADVVDRPRRRLLPRLGLSTPALRTAWLAALLVLLVLPVVAMLLGGRLPVVLAVAPLAPLAAVALAYGRSVEPAGELALATPTAGLRVVSARALLVAVPAVPVGVVAALAAGFPTAVALGWLLPGAALCALVLLAGTTRLDPAVVAASLGSAWAVAVSLPAALRRVPADVVVDLVASPPVQLIALAVALGAAATTVARRDTVAYRRTA